MASVFQPENAQPLDVNDILYVLEERFHSIGFTKDGYEEQIYAVEVEIEEFPSVNITMSDGSKFKLTIEEVQ